MVISLDKLPSNVNLWTEDELSEGLSFVQASILVAKTVQDNKLKEIRREQVVRLIGASLLAIFGAITAQFRASPNVGTFSAAMLLIAVIVTIYSFQLKLLAVSVVQSNFETLSTKCSAMELIIILEQNRRKDEVVPRVEGRRDLDLLN